MVLDKETETQIPIKKVLRERLKNAGKKSETYSDIIERLLNFYEENKKE